MRRTGEGRAWSNWPLRQNSSQLVHQQLCQVQLFCWQMTEIDPLEQETLLLCPGLPNCHSSSVWRDITLSLSSCFIERIHRASCWFFREIKATVSYQSTFSSPVRRILFKLPLSLCIEHKGRYWIYSTWARFSTFVSVWTIFCSKRLCWIQNLQQPVWTLNLKNQVVCWILSCYQSPLSTLLCTHANVMLLGTSLGEICTRPGMSLLQGLQKYRALFWSITPDEPINHLSSWVALSLKNFDGYFICWQEEV